MQPTRTLWLLVLATLCALLCAPLTRRGVTPWVLCEAQLTPGLLRRAQPRAERLGTAWAWAAYAECQPLASDDQWRAFGRALLLDPRDEATLVRRATCWTLRRDTPAERAGLAVTELLATYPDNAAGWYLRAALDARAGLTQAALEALRRGQDTPRLDLACLTTAARVQRFSGWRAHAGWDDWVACRGRGPWVGLARDLSAQPEERTPLATALLLAHFGERLRDQGETFVQVGAGISIERWALALPPGRTDIERDRCSFHCLGNAAGNDRPALTLAAAQAFDRRLAAAGYALPADWAVTQATRSERVRERLVDAKYTHSPLRAGQREALRWYAFALTLWTAALSVLVGLRPRPTVVLEPTWRQVSLAACLPVGVALLFAALVAYALLQVRLPAAALAYAGAGFGPLLLGRLALRFVAPGVPTRQLWPRVGSALAALLLLAALSTSVPAGRATGALLAGAVAESEQAALTEARR